MLEPKAFMDSDSGDFCYELSKPLPPLPQDVKQSWGSIFAFTTRRHYLVLFPAILASLAVAALHTVLAIVLGRIFEVVARFGNGNLSGHDAFEAVSRWCLVLLGLGFATCLVNAAFLALWVAFGELQADNARRRVFQSLLAKDMAWFDTLEHGLPGLLSRIQTQTRELQSATAQILGFFLCNVLASCASLIVAMYYSWKMTLVLLATLPVCVTVLYLAARKLEPAIRDQKMRLERATKLARASLAAIDLVKVFNSSSRELRQYREALGLAGAQFRIQARCNSVQMGYTSFWVVTIFILGFWYGVVLVRDGLQPGQVVTTIYSTLAAVQAAEALVSHWLILSKGVAAGSFLWRLVEGGAEDIDGDAHRCRLEYCVGDVEFTDVSFAYPSNPAKAVLQRVSFVFPAGQTTFVVGKSGSGKSTIGSLVANLYQPSSGSIAVDGQPLDRLDTSWIRENVTLIQQESALFIGSLYNNVALGHSNPDLAPKREVLTACQAAMLQSTIATLPQGLDTKVGPGGIDLSGGQKQRVALARAYLRNPTVLVLDEVTSSLDQVSRGLVMDAIREWRKDKTTIIITHDVASIGDDEYVYVLDKAAVARQGFKRDLDDLGWLADDDERRNGIPSRGPEDSIDAANSNLAFVASPSAHRASAGGLPSPTKTGARMSLGIKAGGALQTRTQDMTFCSGDSRAERSISCRAASKELRPLTSIRGRLGLGSGSEEKRMISNVDDDDNNNNNNKNRCCYGQNDDDRPAFVFGAAERRKGVPKLRQTTREVTEEQDSSPRHAPLLSILRTVWPLLPRKKRITLAFGLVVCLVGAATTPVFAYCLSQLMAIMWSSGDKLSEARPWALYLLAMAVADGLGTGVGQYLLDVAGQAWVDGVRAEALSRILRQPKPWFDEAKHAPGRVVECLERNAEEMRHLIGRILPILVFVGVIMTGSVVWALVVSWRLTLVALSPMPLTVAAVRGYAAVSSKWERRCNVGAEDSSALMTETLANIRLVRSLDLAAHQTRRYSASAAHTRSLGMMRAVRTSWLYGLYQSTSYGLTALVFYYGMKLLAGGDGVDVTAVLRVITLLLFGIGTSCEMLNGLPQLTLAQAAAGPLLAYAALPSSSRERLGRRKKKSAVEPVPLRMSELAFAYRGRDLVLRRISLDISPGQSIAIVGASGCGKSTLLSLMLGLYAPDDDVDGRPSLSFSGVAIADVDLSRLRSAAALVPQSPFVFPATVAENMLYGLPEASPLRGDRSWLEAATRAAGLHDFVSSLPRGYATLVGDGGQALSVGQAQRLAIARALVRRPKLLLMDEPTSALDAEAARAVRRAVRRVAGRSGTTVVVATHCPRMMRSVDRVIVLGNGLVIEQGRYDELIRNGGALSHLVSGGRWMDGQTMSG
ncbi:hypothetical protein L249_5568 [Ophiocordyceps polyrhachis-furcata BCC 54312]|uniref:Uncharacterized protein n=1 Tax=Ophiocordyceps polyrhachis-furcata BCC 54312 TaxID=1330021 RepID=A0A367LGT0_9HYPO|nr:hypothetical protein L249_5568 [Ophiocordyceps polyrhachis-furcata BCC 54312]